MTKAPISSILIAGFVSFFHLCQAAGLPAATAGGAAVIRSHNASELVIPVTDFGPEGNQDVYSRYQRFLSSSQRCEILTPGPRVMLTGFGLFSGVPYNISGALIENFAIPEVWPEELSTADHPHVINSSRPLKSGILKQSNHGVKVVNRKLRINQRELSVCLVLIDVLWDFAGAVIAAEMERFQPNLVLMSGRGDSDVILEGGAKNIATKLSGFKSNGDIDTRNTPVSSTIDTGASGDLVVPMTWNNQDLQARIRPLVGTLGHLVSAPPLWRPSNYYICNNISFIALSAAAGFRFKLAGDLIDVNPLIHSRPQIGFMHLPADAEIQHATLPIWVHVYANLIDQALHNIP